MLALVQRRVSVFIQVDADPPSNKARAISSGGSYLAERFRRQRRSFPAFRQAENCESPTSHHSNLLDN